MVDKTRALTRPRDPPWASCRHPALRTVPIRAIIFTAFSGRHARRAAGTADRVLCEMQEHGWPLIRTVAGQHPRSTAMSQPLFPTSEHIVVCGYWIKHVGLLQLASNYAVMDDLTPFLASFRWPSGRGEVPCLTSMENLLHRLAGRRMCRVCFLCPVL